MKAISIRQPWAWLIVHAGKDIENRTWPTRYRGPVLLHAAKGMTRDEHADALEFAVHAINTDPRNAGKPRNRTLRELGFAFEDLPRGGFIGIADLVDCVPAERRTSVWHVPGCFGFKLANVRPFPFTPFKGALGLFEVPSDLPPLSGIPHLPPQGGIPAQQGAEHGR